MRDSVAGGLVTVQGRAGQTDAGQGRLMQDRADGCRAGQTDAGQDRLMQGRAD